MHLCVKTFSGEIFSGEIFFKNFFSLIGLRGAQNSCAQMPMVLRYHALSLTALSIPELSSRRQECWYPTSFVRCEYLPLTASYWLAQSIALIWLRHRVFFCLLHPAYIFAQSLLAPLCPFARFIELQSSWESTISSFIASISSTRFSLILDFYIFIFINQQNSFFLFTSKRGQCWHPWIKNNI